VSVPEPWTPPLRLAELGGHCRLWLGTYTCGDGATLQEAGDDLLRKVARLADALLSGPGFRMTTSKTGLPDRVWLNFLYEVGEIVAAGGDLRTRVFG
jgi:hypothetical protein